MAPDKKSGQVMFGNQTVVLLTPYFFYFFNPFFVICG